MNKRFVFLIALAALVTILLLLNASRSGTSSVYRPSELLEATSMGTKDLPRVRVAGKVLDRKIEYQVEPGFLLEFEVRDPEKDAEDAAGLKVSYAGIKPDMFAAGRDVIIDGDFKDGKLVASKLLTQCPSKYEPPKPGNAEESSGYSEAKSVDQQVDVKSDKEKEDTASVEDMEKS